MQKMMCLTIALAALTACFETEEKEVLPPDSDWSAIVTIVDEAGGRSSDVAGKPPPSSGREVVCTNGHLHEQVLELLRSLNPPRDT